MPSTPDESRDKLKAEIIASGFDEAAAERLLSGPPCEPRRKPPLIENKGREDGLLLGGGGSTGKHTSSRGSVDGSRE